MYIHTCNTCQYSLLLCISVHVTSNNTEYIMHNFLFLSKYFAKILIFGNKYLTEVSFKVMF